MCLVQTEIYLFFKASFFALSHIESDIKKTTRFNVFKVFSSKLVLIILSTSRFFFRIAHSKVLHSIVE